MKNTHKERVVGNSVGGNQRQPPIACRVKPGQEQPGRIVSRCCKLIRRYGEDQTNRISERRRYGGPGIVVGPDPERSPGLARRSGLWHLTRSHWLVSELERLVQGACIDLQRHLLILTRLASDNGGGSAGRYPWYGSSEYGVHLECYAPRSRRRWHRLDLGRRDDLWKQADGCWGGRGPWHLGSGLRWTFQGHENSKHGQGNWPYDKNSRPDLHMWESL